MSSFGATILGLILKRRDDRRKEQLDHIQLTNERQYASLEDDRLRRLNAEEKLLERLNASEDEHKRWKRDQTSEHYHQFMTTFSNFVLYVGDFVPATYASTPVGDIRTLWMEVSNRFGAVLAQLSSTTVIAGPALTPWLALIAQIKAMRLVPYARPHGAPEIAWKYFRSEQEIMNNIYARLPFAMRADLGVDEVRKDVLDAELTAVQEEMEARNLNIDSINDAAELLRDFQMRQLVGHGNNFIIDVSALAPYQEMHIGLQKPLGCVMVVDGYELYVGVLEDLDESTRLLMYRNLLTYIVSGLRDGPNQRDLPGIGRIAVWDPSGQPG